MSQTEKSYFTLLMSHTHNCTMTQLRCELERQEWSAKYPNYCRTCNGWGGKQFHESHGLPYGPAELLFDVCICVENDKCPRCGYASLVDGDGPCPACGWDFDDGLMEPVECVCDPLLWS